MTILEEMAPSVEIYSIDEAFMELTGVQNCMALETFGHRIGKRLNAMGVMTANDLADQSTEAIRKQFSVVMARTVRELRGESCLELESVTPDKQQIMCSRSFGSRISDYDQMREAVCAYAERAAEQLRRENQYCRQVGVLVRTSPHATDEPFYGNQSMEQLLIPTQDTRDIIRVAMAYLDNIWIEGHCYMKAGIVLGDFFSQGVAQLDLFDEHQPHRNSEELMKLIDEMNKSGSGKLWFAGQGINKGWSMKREMLSPAYTTRITDLPGVALK